MEKLNGQGEDIKDIFNLSLDKPLLQWEMDQVKSLEFWNLSQYLRLHQEGKVRHHKQSSPAGTNPSPPPLSSSGPSVDFHAETKVEKEGSKDCSGGPG